MIAVLTRRSFLTGLLLFGLIVVAAMLAGWIAPFDPVKNNYRYRLGAPNDIFLVGTDRFGRDVLSRMLYGARVSLRIGLAVAVLSGVAGALAGLAAGWWSRADPWLMRVMDGLMAFPGLLLAIALAATLGPSEITVVVALTVAYTPRTARVMRGAVLVARAQDYVEAARAVGARTGRLLRHHVLPACAAPLVVQQTYVFAIAILAEAVLSFVGVGPPPPQPTLGSIIADGRDAMVEAPWITLAPGVAIAMLVLGLNLLGDGLRDALDPRMRRML
ncbi:ABC transporter permease [Limobrevibacterium gyesilva]|uniref:ABC transporter permease n=1 Tax=Limobrevibacterium gyesilva TaxID=2991712 RepID=A0AA41YVF2_9PROT|nr:ABC transporter permease [Limobrevibacterium gyesilva]MCW3477248.1 ABC transporter permease [Limobrevibacterium gyesilva]